jgi:hypothetical protein
LAATPTSILGVIVTAAARIDDVQTVSGRTKLISGATTQNGTTQNPPSTYQTMQDMYINDPNTSSAWTATNVNATKIGYERI